MANPIILKAPIDLASHFHWHGDVFTDGQIIDTVTPQHGNTIVNDRAQRAEPVWNRTPFRGVAGDLAVLGTGRARRDQQTVNAQEARAGAVIAGNNPVKATRSSKSVNRPGSGGGSGYWISTRGWSVCFVA